MYVCMYFDLLSMITFMNEKVIDQVVSELDLEMLLTTFQYSDSLFASSILHPSSALLSALMAEDEDHGRTFNRAKTSYGIFIEY